MRMQNSFKNSIYQELFSENDLGIFSFFLPLIPRMSISCRKAVNLSFGTKIWNKSTKKHHEFMRKMTSCNQLERCHFRNLLYIDKAGSEFWYSAEKYPTDLEKKVKLVNFFQGYMDRHLVTTGMVVSPPPESDPPQLHPYLQAWSRTKSATLMCLTNGTFQVRSTCSVARFGYSS